MLSKLTSHKAVQNFRPILGKQFGNGGWVHGSWFAKIFPDVSSQYCFLMEICDMNLIYFLNQQEHHRDFL